jgi:hypothetical protein
MFPFTITYSRRLTNKLSDNDIKGALDKIKKILEDKTAEDVEIKDKELTFSSSFFGHRWNWNIMAPIDKGKITLTLDKEKTILSYKIFMYRLFIITAIMSTFIGLVSGIIGVGVFLFSWLCGANWVIGVLRHSGLINDITAELSKKNN